MLRAKWRCQISRKSGLALALMPPLCLALLSVQASYERLLRETPTTAWVQVERAVVATPWQILPEAIAPQPGDGVLTQGGTRPPESEESLTQLQQGEQLLQSYQRREALSDLERSLVHSFFRDIVSTPAGRALIAELFYSSNDVGVAATMYDLLLDADIKDAELLVSLIERGKREYLPEFHVRIVDLIADHETREGQAFRSEIADYLAQMAGHEHLQLSDMALSQWVWYVSRYQGVQPLIHNYLFSTSASAREEFYQMVEQRGIEDVGERRDVALALATLADLEQAQLDESERQRVDRLAQLLSQAF